MNHPLAAILVALAAAPAAANFSVNKTDDTVVDARALTIAGSFGQAINGLSFQQEALLTHGDYQYLGYYDADRRVCLARRKLPAGEWQVVRFSDYHFKSNDAHNTISIGICAADGTIHLSWDHHVHQLKYRRSKPGVATRPEDVTWDATAFGPITNKLEPGKPIKITYPRFIATPDGGLQFCYRRGGSGNGDRMLVDYNPKTGKWANTRQIDSGKGVFKDEKATSRSRCSYPNGYNYGPKGRLHTTWVWRESAQGANHDLVYVYSEDGGNTWKNNAGESLDQPPHVNSPGATVVKIHRGLGLMNTHGQAVDSQGRIHVVMWHGTEATLKEAGSEPWATRWGPADARRYHHYFRDDDGRWLHRELPVYAGNRPKVFIDADDNAFLIYAARHREAPMQSEVYFERGDLIIMAATAASKWTDWQVIHKEAGPFGNEMLGDPVRWKQSGVLSVMVQQGPSKKHEPTPLRVLDFKFERRPNGEATPDSKAE
jgi:hypothetical protein